MAEFHGYYNPKQDVDIECIDCQSKPPANYTEVKRSQGILGVPATYLYAAEEQHKKSPEHQSNRLNDWEHDLLNPGTERHPELVVGRMSHFIHGKDHNNPWTGRTAEEEYNDKDDPKGDHNA
jgi:hypothetical protein